MKKIALLLGILILFGIFANFAIADSDDEERNVVRETIIKEIKEVGGVKQEVEQRIREKDGEIEVEVRERIKDKEEISKMKREFREKIKVNDGIIEIEGRKIVKIKELDEDGERKEIIVGRINAKTGLNLTADDLGNGTRLRAILSNGRFADIKIMPDRASVVALVRLKAKCIGRNCSVELKEVGNKLAYELETDKESTILLIFKKKMKLSAVVDAETGEIIFIKKPWWAFLANEKDEEETEDLESEGNETETDKVTLCHIPPGNPNARHTIVVGAPAIRAHLAHGDYLGACKGVGNETEPGNETTPGNDTSTGNETQNNFTVQIVEGLGVSSQA